MIRMTHINGLNVCLRNRNDGLGMDRILLVHVRDDVVLAVLMRKHNDLCLHRGRVLRLLLLRLVHLHLRPVLWHRLLWSKCCPNLLILGRILIRLLLLIRLIGDHLTSSRVQHLTGRCRTCCLWCGILLIGLLLEHSPGVGLCGDLTLQCGSIWDRVTGMWALMRLMALLMRMRLLRRVRILPPGIHRSRG
jgi:hypothetical protein